MCKHSGAARPTYPFLDSSGGWQVYLGLCYKYLANICLCLKIINKLLQFPPATGSWQVAPRYLREGLNPVVEFHPNV